MAKIHVDILTPKYALFMKTLLERLGKNHQIIVTSREYVELDNVLGQSGIKTVVVGRHGTTKREKLQLSLERSLELSRLYEDVDLALAQAAPEAARVAFGLGVPYFMTHDSPHAEAQSKLTVPLATYLFTPFAVPKSHWEVHGIQGSRVLQYKALDPMAWIPWASKLPLPEPLSSPGFMEDAKKSRGLVAIREEEYLASYLEGKRAHTAGLAQALAELGYSVVYIPRYEGSEEVKGASIVKGHPIMTPILKECDAFIGAGGTMNAEAALLGTPTYSIYPGSTVDYEVYLQRVGLLKRMTEDELLRHFSSGLDLRKEREVFRRKASKLTSKFENPAVYIADFVESYLSARERAS
ncbi:MAG: DUF354 domain-containing protein [Thermoprotei archaeon]|nr:DUF354 domain-containing protein [TACK group archaeon]